MAMPFPMGRYSMAPSLTALQPHTRPGGHEGRKGTEMTTYQNDQLEKAKQILMSVYWDMIDNKQNKREIARLDTIIAKLESLQNLS